MAAEKSISTANNELLQKINVQLADLDRRYDMQAKEMHNFHVKVCGNGVDTSGGEIGRLWTAVKEEAKERKAQHIRLEKLVVRNIWISVIASTLFASGSKWAIVMLEKFLK